MSFIDEVGDVFSGIGGAIAGFPTMLGGTALSIGGNILGLYGAEQDREFAEEQARRNAELQREFAQHGITWRVEDAKRAGLHPLYALGGAGAAFSPNPIVAGGQQEAYTNIGRSAGQFLMNQAALNASAAQAESNRAQADYYRSAAALNRQRAVQSAPFPDSIVDQGQPNLPEPISGYYDRRKISAAEQFSRSSNDPSAMAGSTPTWKTYEYSPGLMVDLPYSDEGPSETLQDMPLWFYPMFIKKNIEKYGQRWVNQMTEHFPGLPQLKHYGEKLYRSGESALDFFD